MSATQGSVLDRRDPVAPSEAPATIEVPPAARTLDLTMQKQRQDEWCWAAVSTSVTLFYAPASPWTQCTVVNAGLKQTGCCQDGASPSCNVAWFLDQALTIVGHLNQDFAGKLAMDLIAKEIDAGRPVGLCIDWTGGGGHFVAIDGYDLATQMIDVKDSIFGASYIAYASFPVSYQGGGSWGWTYLTC